MKSRNTISGCVRTTVLMVVLGICSISSAQDLGGQWQGYWHSNANNHRGRINATFCQTDATVVQARFTGTFAKIIPFRYRTRLNVAYQEPGLTILSGSKRLPFSGEFRYYAEISDGCFRGTFSSPRNRGTWMMSR
jgi:hypothetical protein